MITLGKSDIVQLLLQVHDSTVSQFRIPHKTEALLQIRSAMEIVVPYEDPLVIPASAEVSDRSWGHCTEINWPEAS